MSNSKKKKQTPVPKGKKEKLSEKDLDKVAGGKGGKTTLPKPPKA